MRLTRALANPWTWAAALTLAHLAATAALYRSLETLYLLRFVNGVFIPVGGGSVVFLVLSQSTHELLVTGLTLLHLPLRTLDEWQSLSQQPMPPWAVWAAFGLDSAIQSFAAVATIRILTRPPRRFRLPFLSRRVVLLGLALAAVHLTASATIIAAARFTATPAYQSHGIPPALIDAFELLQPLVGRGALRPYGLAEPETPVLLLLDSAAWGAVTAVLVTLVRRTFFPRAQS